SHVLLGGGIGLILMAFVLGFESKGGSYNFNKENFAETFGALLLGLISLGFGYYLQQAQEMQGSPVQFLVGKVHALKLINAIIGFGSLIGFGYLLYTHRTDFLVYFPELLALFCMSVLCLGCVLWLNAGEFDEFGIRLLILVFGGATGVILF